MGHAQSKKKKYKHDKYNKEFADYINRNLPANHEIKKFNRLSVDVDKLSQCSEPFIHTSSVVSSKRKYRTMPITHDAPSREGSPLLKTSNISYKDIKIDDHPDLTKLQNEQNARLEKMEERMNKIRLHAMQEADRRKYAYLFRAKSRESPTKELLLKAKEKVLSKQIICDVSQQKSDNKCVDQGEVIPVTIVREPVKKHQNETQELSKVQKLPTAFDNINLSDPKSVLLLPFLLPVFLLLFMVRSISQSDRWKREVQKKT